MEVFIETENNVTTARFVGRLDTPASQEVAKSIDPILENPTVAIVLDCKDMTYISSSGLRIFLTLRKTAASKGGKVIIKSISPVIRQVFMMTGFLNLFEIQG